MVTYRRDIDGPRALAVPPVVVFHAAPSLMPGGFIGVDIFFVISGFLITSILADQLKRGSFTPSASTERRVRRILPALCACVAVSAMTAILLLPPEEMTDFGKSLMSVVLFSSNVFFWRQGGYFAGPAHDKPLLHTWSLSVEEQFYLASWRSASSNPSGSRATPDHQAGSRCALPSANAPRRRAA